MIMDREKLTAGAFASIGVAQATISYLGPRNKYQVEVILRLHQRYNDINLESTYRTR